MMLYLCVLLHRQTYITLLLRDRTGSVLRLPSRLDLDHQRGRGKGEQAQLIISVYRGV